MLKVTSLKDTKNLCKKKKKHNRKTAYSRRQRGHPVAAPSLAPQVECNPPGPA